MQKERINKTNTDGQQQKKLNTIYGLKKCLMFLMFNIKKIKQTEFCYL